MDNQFTALERNKEATEKFALTIWNFIQERQKKFRPTSICVYHYIDGTVAIECDNHIFSTIRHYSNDETLLQSVSSLAEQSNINGKMFLHSSKNFLNILDLKFSY